MPIIGSIIGWFLFQIIAWPPRSIHRHRGPKLLLHFPVEQRLTVLPSMLRRHSVSTPLSIRCPWLSHMLSTLAGRRPVWNLPHHSSTLVVRPWLLCLACYSSPGFEKKDPVAEAPRNRPIISGVHGPICIPCSGDGNGSPAYSEKKKGVLRAGISRG